MTDLPFETRTNEIFPTKVWVADLSFLDAYQADLVADLVQPQDKEGDSHTEPALRTEPRWRETIAAAVTLTDALCRDLRPPWRERMVRSWATVSRAPDEQRPRDENIAHQGATISTILWLQIPEELANTPAMAFRDPLFHLNDRLGFPAYGDVVPREMRLVAFPGYLERFNRVAAGHQPFSVPLVTLCIDVAYY